MKDITIVELIEENLRTLYRANLSVLENDTFCVQMIQEHYDTVLAVHPGQAKPIDFVKRLYSGKQCGRMLLSLHGIAIIANHLTVLDTQH